MQTGKRDGMQLMDDALAALVRDGQVLLEDAVPYAVNRETVERAAQSRRASHPEKAA